MELGIGLRTIRLRTIGLRYDWAHFGTPLILEYQKGYIFPQV